MEKFEKELNEELLKRIEIIEDNNYEFPQQIEKLDYICIIIAIVICLVGIIWGAFW